MRGSIRLSVISSIALAVCAVHACMAVPVPNGSEELSVEILADSNRDGRVDDQDRQSVVFANGDYGAIILPNIGDQERRCPGSENAAWSDAELEACHDAQDETPRAPDYFAPVRLMPVSNLTAAAEGFVQAKGTGAETIRVFLKTESGWDYLSGDDAIPSALLAQGLELGVDARDIVRDASVWDGRIELEFRVTDGDAEASDSVTLRVAPVIIHNHLENANTLFAPQSDGDVHEAFMAGLTQTVSETHPDLPLQRLNTVDNWAQDFVEFGHVSMPDPDGLKSIRVAVRSPQPTRSAGRALFDLKGPGIGVVQTGGDNYHQVDSFGNLETIPPYEHNGQSYPAGRVIYGDSDDGVGPHTDFAKFFEAQAVQAPIVLDTSWLIIAHVDEFLQFLPAENDRGWTIAVKDVPSALAILQDAEASGHGDTKAFSIEGGPEMSISDLLSDAAFLEANERARRRIEMTLGRLMSETGVTEDELVRVPGLFEVADWDDVAQRASVRAEQLPRPPWLAEEGPASEIIYYSPGNLLAFYPAPVNGVLLDQETYILPKQWGPIVDGVDIMEAEIIEIYAKAGIEAYHFKVAHRTTIGPHFEDNLSTYRMFGSNMRSILMRTSMAKLSPETRDTWRLRDHAQVLYTLFPGSSLLVQSDHISWIQSEPVGPGKTRLRLSTLAPKSEAEKADHWKRNHEITRTTLDEDFVIGESMQSTLKSGANENMLFGRFEGALDAFNRTVEAHMTPPSPQAVAAE